MALDNKQDFALSASNGVSAKASSRIVGLDALRGLLLAFGVFVHTANLKVEPAFEWIEYTSNLFRMPAFFFLSGLLAALTMERHTPKKWIVDRFVALGVPLLFGLLILNPLFFLLHSVVTQKSFMIGFFDRNHFTWHLHLWFLFSLLFYTLVAWIIRAFESRRIQKTVIRTSDLMPTKPDLRFTVAIALLAIPLVATTAALAASRLLSHIPQIDSIRFIVSSTITYIPFYIFGFFIPRSKFVRSAFSSNLYLLVGCFSILTLSNRIWEINPLPIEGIFVEILMKTSRLYFSLLFILLVIPFVYKIKTIPKFLFFLSNSAYTIYILHILIISIFLFLFSNFGFGIYIAYAATVVATLVVSLSIHFGLCNRFLIVRFLLNGKRR